MHNWFITSLTFVKVSSVIATARLLIAGVARPMALLRVVDCAAAVAARTTGMMPDEVRMAI
jgi:hypothetical protein